MTPGNVEVVRPELVTPIVPGVTRPCRHCDADPTEAYATHPPTFGPLMNGLGREILAFGCLEQQGDGP